MIISLHRIRYCYGNDVLWIRPLNEGDDVIPPCNWCGSARLPEIQLLSSIIYLTGEEDLVDGMDWGTAVVFTCAESCRGQSSDPYATEVVIVQK